MSVRIASSVYKHRVSEARMLYVLEHHVWAYSVGRGVTLLMGPDRNGIDLEIGTVRRGGDNWIIHAMKVRRAFLDEYRGHLPWRK